MQTAITTELRIQKDREEFSQILANDNSAFSMKEAHEHLLPKDDIIKIISNRTRGAHCWLALVATTTDDDGEFVKEDVLDYIDIVRLSFRCEMLDEVERELSELKEEPDYDEDCFYDALVSVIGEATEGVYDLESPRDNKEWRGLMHDFVSEVMDRYN